MRFATLGIYLFFSIDVTLIIEVLLKLFLSQSFTDLERHSLTGD